MFFGQSIAYAEQNQQAMIVFDASGSMWGKIDAKTKIDIAKETMQNVVSGWDENVYLGLLAYGHRKKGDCTDIEILTPISKIDKEAIISKVKQINPKGKTPISRSLQIAADALKYTEEKATIILISDGKETCGLNPCEIAAELEKQGIDFTAHVIGFDVDLKTSQQLECIANATGGEYFSAKNANSLNDAMKSIVKEVVQDKIPQPEPVVAQKIINNVEITASEKKDGKWIEAFHDIYIESDSNSAHGVNCWSQKNKPCLQHLEVGNYIIKSKYNKFNKETPLTITDDKSIKKIHIVMNETGKVAITASEKEGGKWIEAFHNIYKVVDGKTTTSVGNRWSKDKASILQIPVGKYIIKSKYNKIKKETPLEIKAGETVELQVLFPEK